MLQFKAWRKSPALTLETTPSQRRIVRILSKAQQAAAQEFGQKLTRVAQELSTGHVERVLGMLPIEPWIEAQDSLAAELLTELLDAGSRVTLPAIEKAALSYSFDRTRPESEQWARLEAGQLISNITTEQRTVVRDVVSSAARGELAWNDIARRVQGSIGLTTQQAEWVSNRYDRVYGAKIAAGASNAQAAAQAQEAANRYQTSVHRYRANTIARTETMRAASEGRIQSWNQGLTEGYIGLESEKEWIAESSACNICEPLSGERVGIKDSFPHGEPPAHPNCRCDVLLVPGGSPAGRGGLSGLAPHLALIPFHEMAFEFLPFPHLELDHWRMAWDLTRPPGDDRSFSEWMHDMLEPDLTVHAMESEEGGKKWRDSLPNPDDVAFSGGSDFPDFSDMYGNFFADPAQKEALQMYQHDYFSQINQALRSGGPLGKWLNDVNLLDALFDSVPAFKVTNGQFFRVLDRDVFAGLRRGDTFIEKGFMSTSITRSTALRHAADEGLDGKMRIIDTAGIRKIWVDGITFSRYAPDEVLFHRGTRLTYLGLDKDGWHTFTTAPSKKPRATGPPPKPTFRPDDEFLDLRNTGWSKYSSALLSPTREFGFDLDPETARALQWYQGDGFRKINAYMVAEGKGSWSSDVREAARLLNDLFDGVRTQRPIRVWRGLHNSDFLGPLTPGTVFVNQSFMSTSASLDVAAQFFSRHSRNPAILRINAPRGSEAFLMPEGYEDEVLFRPGVKLRVIKTVMERIPGVNYGDPVKVIYVEVVP